jgi:hypothetical protein
MVRCQRGIAGVSVAFLMMLPVSASAVVVNIDATQYGHSIFDASPPTLGRSVAPFGPGGDANTGVEGNLNQIVLGAGTYSVTNAAGERTASLAAGITTPAKINPQTRAGSGTRSLRSKALIRKS